MQHDLQVNTETCHLKMINGANRGMVLTDAGLTVLLNYFS